MVLITIYHGKSPKRPHHTNVAQKVAIYICRKKFPSFVMIQTLYKTKELNWFPIIATEIIFFWPTLRSNCHGMLFTYLPQFLYKDTEQNWYIDILTYWVFAAGRYLPFPLLITFHNSIHENRLITFTWQPFANKFMLFIAWRLF